MPYITVVPELSFREMNFDSSGHLVDSVLVMASDGVFEHASNTEVIDWASYQKNMSNKESGRSGPFREENDLVDENDQADYSFFSILDGATVEESPAKQIVESVMNKISANRNKSRRQLESLPRGRQRRWVVFTILDEPLSFVLLFCISLSHIPRLGFISIPTQDET
mgnify:CR=1 FL=1